MHANLEVVEVENVVQRRPRVHEDLSLLLLFRDFFGRFDYGVGIDDTKTMRNRIRQWLRQLWHGRHLLFLNG